MDGWKDGQMKGKEDKKEQTNLFLRQLLKHVNYLGDRNLDRWKCKRKSAY
jgi:hypothetical protein